eukprot:365871-Chlamydomonas_euryale.AAC.3
MCRCRSGLGTPVSLTALLASWTSPTAAPRDASQWLCPAPRAAATAAKQQRYMYAKAVAARCVCVHQNNNSAQLCSAPRTQQQLSNAK